MFGGTEVQIVRSLYAHWQKSDLPPILPLLADDMVFALHIPPEVMPGGGEVKGKPAVTAALQGLLDTYAFLAYEPLSVDADGAEVSAVVRYQYRHRASGETIDSRMRHRWAFADGKVTRLDEWHDLDVIAAFAGRVMAKPQPRE